MRLVGPPALVFVLHAHLPWVRHAQHDDFAEERWLHEAIGECYLPLLARLRSLADEGVPFRLSLSVTPTLASMLDDALLRTRFERWSARLERLAARELARARGEGRRAEARALGHALRGVTEARATWDAIGGDVLSAFGDLARRGHVELLASAATHAFLPGFVPAPRIARAQLQLGALHHRLTFGVAPRAIWLPECGWAPSLDGALAAAGLVATVLDAHGLSNATPRPPHGRLAAAITPAGVVVLPRDPGTAESVWSRETGYPADLRYRDFHRDAAHELPAERLDDVQPDGLAASGIPTGLHLRAITSREHDAPKQPYDPALAADAVREHAAHFVAQSVERLEQARAAVGERALIVAAYDAELFGHWWHEGPDFLVAVLRSMATATATVTEAATRAQRPAIVMPSMSSWGEGGYGSVWIDEASAPTWRALHAQAAALPALVAQHRDSDDPLVVRALVQTVREALLAQASDWPFLVRGGSAAEYARTRLADHVAAADELSARIAAGPAAVRAALARLSRLEADDAVLPRIGPRAMLETLA